jgi:hypothetical protein
LLSFFIVGKYLFAIFYKCGNLLRLKKPEVRYSINSRRG